MNDKMLDIIGLADEKYLHEAEGKPVMKQTKHRRKLSAKVVAVAAAAAVMTVTAGAYAVAKLSNKKSVGEFYDSSAVSKMESRGMLSDKVFENEHFRFNLQSVIKDDYVCSCIIAVEPLDEKAQDYLGRNGFDADVVYADTGEVLPPNVLSSCGWKEYKKGDKAVNIEFDITYRYGNSKVNSSRPLKLKFKPFESDLNGKDEKEIHLLDGIAFDVPEAEKLNDVKLYSDDGKELYLSEVGFTALVPIPYPKTDEEFEKQVKNGEFEWDFEIKFKDGTVKTGRDFNMDAGGIGLMLDNTDVGFRQAFRTMIDIDKVESVKFKNIVFKRK